MFEIKIDVNVKCPDLIAILEKLNTCACKDAPKQNLPVLNDLVNRPQPAVSNLEPAPMPDQAIPPNTSSAGAPAVPYTVVETSTTPVAPTVTPIEAPAPAVPVETPPTEAPSFTLAQISKAGADLLTAKPALQPQLVTLLGKYGAQTVATLKPEHFGAFATELRAMGGKI